MNADHLEITQAQRMYLSYMVMGLPFDEIIKKIPNSKKKGANGVGLGVGVDASTVSQWRGRSATFVRLEQRYMKQPDLFHKEVVVPLLIAAQDAQYMESINGIGPRLKLSARDKELMMLDAGLLKGPTDGISSLLVELVSNRRFEPPQPPRQLERTMIDVSPEPRH